MTEFISIPVERANLEDSEEERFRIRMAENEENVTSEATNEGADQSVQSAEEITYHAVEKDGQVTAIWEMQGRKHLRTIDPRSRQGQEILRLYTTEHHEEA